MSALMLEPTGIKLAAAAALSILTLLSGFWLSRTGKPYNTWFFNLHKLIAVAMIVLLVIGVFNLVQSVELQTVLVAVAMGMGALLFLALVISGAMLSLDVYPRISLKVHRIAPLLALAASAFTVFMLVGYRV